MTSDQQNEAGAFPDFRYWAFISYSQRDVEWAQWLHEELETYRVPRQWIGRQVGGNRKITPRLIPIFRDRDELPSAGDLGSKIREALEASYALIVICSPYAAASPWVNEEVRTFKSFGRSQRVFPLIIDGEPFASERPSLGLPECFPPALRFAVAADGTLTDRRADPLAADARQGKDGRSAARLKLIAGILGVGFDDLRRREAVRQRQRRLIGGFAAVAGGLLMAAAYIGLADGDINVPGGAAIRTALDHYRLSLLRPVISHQAVVRRAAEARERLRARLVDAVAQGKVNMKRDFTASVWSLGQIAAGIYRDPDATDDDLRPLIPLIDRVFDDDFVLKSDGNRVGWPGDGPLPRVETALWVMNVLTHALKRKGGAIETIRERFMSHLNTVQEIAENYYPLRDGGWNVVMQSSFEEHNFYSSALALNTLLELDAAHLCWRGSCERLAQMIRESSQWFIDNFVDEKRVTGWRRTVDDDGAPDPELSLMVYAGLGRSPMPLPENIRNAALQQLTDLRSRPYHPANHDIRHWVTYLNDAGKWESLTVPARVHWYPWATEAIVQWQRRAEQENYPKEVKLGLARSLGHVVVADSTDMVDDMSRAALFTVGETYYGLGSVR